MTERQEHPAEFHFARVWAARNDEYVHVFASGHVFDRAARRRTVRQAITAIRSYRAHCAVEVR